MTIAAQQSEFSQANCLPVRRALVPAGFTLIELILVMAILTISVSMAAPALSRFFRGRTLNSEARQLLALTRNGQSRAACEGIPMDLWIDADQGKFGLAAEPSYETLDPKAEEFTIGDGLHFEVANKNPAAASTNQTSSLQTTSIASVPPVSHAHPGLPTIRFQPDGTIADSSPQSLRLIDRDGSVLWLAQSKNRLNYEIRSTEN
jgi:type II secretion system protein H